MVDMARSFRLQLWRKGHLSLRGSGESREGRAGQRRVVQQPDPGMGRVHPAKRGGENTNNGKQDAAELLHRRRQ